MFDVPDFKKRVCCSKNDYMNLTQGLCSSEESSDCISEPSILSLPAFSALYAASNSAKK